MSEFVGLWTLKRPACMHRRLGSTTLLQLAFLEESNPNFPWEQSEWDDTVIKQDQGGPQLTLSQRKVRFTVQRTVRSDGRHNQVGDIYISVIYIWSMCDYLRFTRLHLINVWLFTFHSFTSDQCVTSYVSLVYIWSMCDYLRFTHLQLMKHIGHDSSNGVHSWTSLQKKYQLKT